MAEVFISYAREDQGFARDLHTALQKVNRDTWIDWRSIPDSAKWRAEIFAAIEAADNFLFVISPDSAKSWMCGQEVAHAVANNKRLITVLYRPVETEELLPALREIQWIDYSNLGFEQTFERLTAAIDTDLEWVRAHTRLLIRAKEWEREAKDSSFLLRGKDLREAEQWVAKSAEKTPKPTTLHSQYILASREAATKLQRIVIGAVAAAFLIAVGLAVYAFIQKNLAQRETKEAEHQRSAAETNAAEAKTQKTAAEDNAAEAGRQKDIAIKNENEAKRQQSIAEEETVAAQRNARESKARELAAYATESLSEDPERSIFLGMQAVNATLRYGRPPVPAAEEVLHKAILSSVVRMTLKGHTAAVISVAWSPDGKRLATASQDKTAKVWDAASGKELLTLKGHGDFVTGVAWSPDGKRLATASQDKTAKVWDAASGQELVTLTGHTDCVIKVAWSPDGNKLATAGQDKTARVWDANSGQEMLNLKGHGASGMDFIYSVAWSPDGKRLATASVDQTSKVWDAASGQELLTLKGRSAPGTDVVFSVAWSPDGKRLATASQDKTAKVWDAASGQELLTRRGHDFAVLSIAWSPDGKRLATASSEDQTSKVWDAASGQELLTLSHRGLGGWGSGLAIEVAWSPDGKRLATGGWNSTATLWDAAGGQELLTLKGHGGYVTSVAWSPDGKRLATARGGGG